MSGKKFFKKTDIAVLLVIIAAAITGFLIYRSYVSDKSAVAEIYYYSQLVETVELNTGEDRTFSIPQDKNVVFHLYPDGGIAFVESDCPDKICIHSGILRTPGQSAACLPNGIILKIVPRDGGDGDIDIIAGN